MDNIIYTHMFLTFCEVCCARPTGDHEEQLIVEQDAKSPKWSGWIKCSRAHVGAHLEGVSASLWACH